MGMGMSRGLNKLRGSALGTESVVVLGLGRFGRALAEELAAAGTEVLGIDKDEDVVQSLDGVLTHVVRADTTREEALRQLSVPDFDLAVVGIGTDIQSSILTTSLLLGFEVPSIWAKAISGPHGRILDQLGVHHVVYPEADMGRRTAHLVRGALLDFVQFEEDFALVKMRPPMAVVGVPLSQARLRAKHGVTVVAARSAGDGWTYVTQDSVLRADDTILVAGPTRLTEAFAQLGRERERRIRSA